jgi:hypothetical protein
VPGRLVASRGDLHGGLRWPVAVGCGQAGRALAPGLKLLRP